MAQEIFQSGGKSLPPEIYQEKTSVTDNSMTEIVKWDWVNGRWRPTDEAVTGTLVEQGSNFIMTNGKLSYFFDLPEALDYIGLPMSVFLSIEITYSPVVRNDGTRGKVIATTQPWTMTIDVADLLDQAQILPQSINLFDNFAYLSCYLFGYCKNITSPQIRVTVDTFWTTSQNPYQFAQWGNITAGLVADLGTIQELPAGFSGYTCSSCKHQVPNDWSKVLHRSPNSLSAIRVVNGSGTDDQWVHVNQHGSSQPEGEGVSEPVERKATISPCALMLQ